jgi:hypothetical protein
MPRLTERQRATIAADWQASRNYSTTARKHSVTRKTVYRIIADLHRPSTAVRQKSVGRPRALSEEAAKRASSAADSGVWLVNAAMASESV